MTRPSTRMFQAIGRLNRTRSALVDAVRDTDSLPELRAAVLELASDIESFLDGHEPASEIAESRRDTVPCPPPAFEPPTALVDWKTQREREFDGNAGCDVCATLRANRRGTPCRHCIAERYLGVNEDSAPNVPCARPSGGP